MLNLSIYIKQMKGLKKSDEFSPVLHHITAGGGDDESSGGRHDGLKRGHQTDTHTHTQIFKWYDLLCLPHQTS